MALLAAGIFTLTAAAKSNGCDRYSGHFISTSTGQAHALDVYLPQIINRCIQERCDSISRVLISLNSLLADECAENVSWAVLALDKQSHSGGDKYSGCFRFSEEEKVAIYVPQGLSRKGGAARAQLFLKIETDPDAIAAGEAATEAMKQQLSVDAVKVPAAGTIDASPEGLGDLHHGVIATGQFSIFSVAKGSGGDRYRGTLLHCSSSDTFPLDIYIPQCLSRKRGLKPFANIIISLSDLIARPVVSGVQLKLTKSAKSSRGDRYDGAAEESGKDKITVYLPQGISRSGSSGIRKDVILTVLVLGSEESTGTGAAIGATTQRKDKDRKVNTNIKRCRSDGHDNEKADICDYQNQKQESELNKRKASRYCNSSYDEILFDPESVQQDHISSTTNSAAMLSDVPRRSNRVIMDSSDEEDTAKTAAQGEKRNGTGGGDDMRYMLL